MEYNINRERNVCTVIDLELMIFQNVNTIVMRNSAIYLCLVIVVDLILTCVICFVDYIVVALFVQCLR